MRNVAYLAAGMFIGVGIVFYQIDTPHSVSCGTYKVASKIETAYVLKPPPAEVIYKACPQTTEKVYVTKTPENVTQSDLTNTSDTQVKETPKNEHETRRHRRHHRVRRYWR
jgi:hypothetical protein